MVTGVEMLSAVYVLLGSCVGFINCDDDDPEFETYYNTAVSTVTIIGIVTGIIALAIIVTCVVVICCCCMRSSRNRGHVYRQPNTPMNYTAVTVPPPQQQVGYPPAVPQGYPPAAYPPAQSGMVQHTAYPPATYPAGGMVQHSTNVTSGYPHTDIKAEPTAPPADLHEGHGQPSSGFEKPPPYPGY